MPITREQRRRQMGTPAEHGGGHRSSAAPSPSPSKKGSAASGRDHKTTPTAAVAATPAAARDSSRAPSGSLREGTTIDHVPVTPAQRSARLSNATGPSVSVSPTLKRMTASKVRSSGVSFGEGSGSILESPGKRVSISGTTFMATDSEQEGHELELDLGSALDELPGLVASSDETLGELARTGISRQQVQRFLRHRFFASKIASMTSKFEAQKRAFGTADYIPVDLAAELFPTAGGREWTPAPLYHRANLARLTLDVLALPRGTTEASSFEKIDSHFPSYFLGSFQSDEERQSTFRLGLEIRTQWCLVLFRKAVQSDEHEDPDEILQNIYSSPSLDPKPEDLRGWDMDGLKEGDSALPQEFQEAVLERMYHIRQTFDAENMDEDDDGNNNGGGVDIDSLNEMFPWSEFVVHLLTWVRGRANEIDLHLQSQEPLDRIIPILQGQLGRRSGFGQDNAELQQETETSPAKTSRQRVSGVTREPEQTQLQSPESKAGAFSRTVRTNFNKKSLVEHMESRFLQATRTLPKPQSPLDGSVTEVSHAQGRDSRKHIIDRQAGAERVSPIESVHGSGGSRTKGKSPRKRTADVLEDDDDDHAVPGSSSFQRDDRDVDVEGNRAHVAAMTATARKRQRVAEDGRRRDKGDGEHGDSGATSSKPPTEQRVTTTVETSDVKRGQPRVSRPLPSWTGVEQPPEQRDGVQTAAQRRRVRDDEADGDYQDTNGDTESVRSSPKPAAAPRPTGRRRWLPQETQRLIYLIGKYGTSWTLIADMDMLEPGEPKLASRKDDTQEKYQVKLRDRAEQIVFDYYRAGVPLPRNLQKVQLRGRMIRQLQEYGVEVPATHRPPGAGRRTA